MIKKSLNVYIAYADREGRNEFLIRDGNKYYVLTSHKKVFPMSAEDAYRTLILIQKRVLSYRGSGAFKQKIKNILKGVN